MSRKPLFLLVTGFIFGVAISSFLNFDFGLAALFILLAGILSVLLLCRLSETRNGFLITLIILLSGFGLGIGRYEIKDAKDFGLENLINEKINFQGMVIEESDERENYTRLIVRVSDIGCRLDITCPNSKILIYSRHYPKFKYGDLVLVKGELLKPKKFNNSIAELDWPAYLAKDNIFYEMFYPKITLVADGRGNKIKSWLFSLKKKFLDNISSVIPEPAASFLGGITVGAKKSIPKDLQDDFIAAGIIHVIVLSGYNVTIIARGIMLIFEIFTPRIIATLIGGLGILIFAIMTGGSATVVRASIMAIIVLLAKNIGRFYNITIALLIAGFLMILHNPKILRFDTSFQLSFLATIGLIYLPPLFEKIKILKSTPKSAGRLTNSVGANTKNENNMIAKIKTKIRETAITTISAQLSVTPFLLYTMSNLSIVALPVNLLILLFIPATMFFGFMTGILGFASQIISVPFAWISYGFISYELWIVKIFSSLPFASVKIQNFPAFATIFIYGIMAIILIIGAKNNDKK